MKPLVYVAGPYTRPDPVTNTRTAVFTGDALVNMGAAVIIPHLSMLWHTISPAPLEDWYERDLDVMAHCHLVVRVPGASTGADAEVAEARRIGIPVMPWTPDTSAVQSWIGAWTPVASEARLPDGCIGGHSPDLMSCEMGVDWP